MVGFTGTAPYSATKDPDATLDYGFDWSDWLAEGDFIASSMWFSDAPTVLTVDDSSKTDTTTRVVVSGGVTANRYTLTNRITTSAGLTDDRSIRIRIQEQ